MGATLGCKQDLKIGQKFGRLLVIKYDKGISELMHDSHYLCQCECGMKKTIIGKALRSNSTTKSCGCLKRENMKRIDHSGEKNSHYYHGLCIEAKKFRETVRERDKVCQQCGMTREESLLKYDEELSVHHLDGNHYNNVLNNGVALCKGCHATITNEGNVWRPLCHVFL